MNILDAMNKMNPMVRMVTVLSFLCATSGFLLSSLKASTANSIEEQVLTYVQEPAIVSIFPQAENNPVLERQKFTLEDETEVTVFPYIKDGKLIGVAIENFATGYAGALGIMVGFDINTDRLMGIGVTTIKETPGIGTRILEPFFINRFSNLASDSVGLSSEGGTIDTLAGVTISSVATVIAVQRASKDYLALKNSILEIWK